MSNIILFQKFHNDRELLDWRRAFTCTQDLLEFMGKRYDILTGERL